jgi:hypothetical protein
MARPSKDSFIINSVVGPLPYPEIRAYAEVFSPRLLLYDFRHDPSSGGLCLNMSLRISPECRDNNYKNAQETDGMTPYEYHQRQIAEAIARAERRTDAELVTVLARRADDYAYWPLLWAAVLALAVPGCCTGWLGWPGVRRLAGGATCCCSSACACCCAIRAWPPG